MVTCATIQPGTLARGLVFRCCLVIPIFSAMLLASPVATGRAFTSDESDHHRPGQFWMDRSVSDQGFSFRTPSRKPIVPPQVGAAGVVSAVTGIPFELHWHGGGSAVPPLLGRVFPPCSAPAVAEAASGLVGLPGTPGVVGSVPTDRHALLARRAFLHGCESATAPCTGFDAVPPLRMERPRAIPRLSLATGISPLRRTPWALAKAPHDMVVRDYVDVVELIAMGRWHGSVMAPLVRIVMPLDTEAGAAVVVADDMPGRLDIGDTEAPGLLDMAGGWNRRGSDAEILALIALGLAPPRRERRALSMG